MLNREPTLELLVVLREADERVDPRDLVHELRRIGQVELAMQLNEMLRRRASMRRRRDRRARALQRARREPV